MKIGVVIPYYENSKEVKARFEYLMDTLDNQIKKNIELVVVDDGCNTLWVDKFERENIKVIHMYHVGVSEARNIGMRYLKNKGCKYIGFLDSDDSVSNDYIEEAYKLCKIKEYDYIDSRFVQSGIEVFGTRELRKNQLEVVRNGVAGTFFSTKIIGNKEFNKELKNGEDEDFVKRVIDIKKVKKGISEGIYVYNFGVNPNSIVMRAQRGEEL